MDIYALAQQCSPQLERQVVASIAHTESKFNTYAIGVVGGWVKPAKTLTEAIMQVRELRKAGRDFSVGLSQVNQSNFAKYGLTEATMFDPCTNLKAGGMIFKSCLDEANRKYGKAYSYDGKLRLAASCYYSGNFTTGFKADFPNQPPYVTKFYTKLLEYRGAAKQLPNIVAPTAPAQLILTSPFSQPSQKSIEYNAIVKAIQLQKSQLAENEAKDKPVETKIINETSAEVESEPNFNGDVFATPKKDVFSKRNV